jgi:hypothetical protein
MGMICAVFTLYFFCLIKKLDIGKWVKLSNKNLEMAEAPEWYVV